MDRSSKRGGENDSVTPSTASLNRKPGISSAPRMLTASERALLKRSKAEIAAAYEAERKSSAA